MKKQTKIIIAIVAIVVIAAVIGGIIIMLTQNKEQEPRYTTDEIREVYWWQNHVFVLNGDRYSHHTFQDSAIEHVYVRISCYEKETGNQLTIDKVRDYLSSEYEEDGELQLYISGKYPDIKNFIEWYKENEETVERYNSTLISIWGNYKREQEDVGNSISTEFSDLTVEQREELIKKEADPNYELDLGDVD